MLDTLFSLAQDNPLLFGIVIFNVFLGGYILIYFSLYLYKKRHPEILLNILLWKTSVRQKHPSTTIEELYGSVTERIRREKILSKSDGTGKLAREKSLAAVEGAKKDVLCDIYALYERKVYGKEPVEDEHAAVRLLLDRLLAV